MTDWSRREGEPTKWFRRFERYRLMGSNRSLLGAYKSEPIRKSQNGRPRKEPLRAPPSWTPIADKWEWKARAEAWDMLEAEKEAAAAEAVKEREREEREAERIEWKAKRRLLAQGLYSKAAEALTKLGKDNELASLNQVANTVKIVLVELRAEFDDLPTQRGRVLTFDPAKLAEMSDEELDEMEEAVKRYERISA